MEDEGKSVKKERVNKCQKPQKNNIRGRQKGIEWWLPEDWGPEPQCNGK